jgi:hypothetical protein
MRRVILTLSLLFAASPAFACLESYTSLPLVISGKVPPGKTVGKEISPGFYFAAGKWPGELVKVAKTPDPHIYLWLIPEGNGWLLRIGPAPAMVPDYITVTALPFSHPIDFSAAKPAKRVRFCFTMEPRDYDAAVKDVKASGESGIIDILSAQCEKNDEGVGRGILTTSALPGGRVRFEADLNIPVYTTDCPAR